MRITALNKSYPLSYDSTANNASLPIFGPSNFTGILNTSSSVNIYTNPVVDLGGHPFAVYNDFDYLQIKGMTGVRAIPSNHSLGFGYFMPIPLDDEKYAYNVSGNIRPGTYIETYESIHFSLIVAHLDTTHVANHLNEGAVDEYYVCNVISEIPLVSNDVDVNDNVHFPISHFNISFHDNGTPPNETSSLFFALCIRDSSLSGLASPSAIFTIDVWRQIAPLKMYNQWQA